MTSQDRKDYNRYKRLVQQGHTEYIPAVQHFDPEFRFETPRREPELSKSGEANGNSKLTGQAVQRIRQMYQQGQLQKQIAERFGITRPTVSYIVNRKTWRHV